MSPIHKIITKDQYASYPVSYFSEMGVVNYSKDIYGNPDRTYETLRENENGVLHNQTELSLDINNQLYRNISNPASFEQEYTYAQGTQYPRSSVGTNNAVYHTLEQPEQQPDDGSYSYPDNTRIRKLPTSELEYTYAKDTDLPRVNVDTAAKDPASIAVYHTLEQSEQPTDDDSYSYPDTTSTGTSPPELEYTYAKDTDLPRVNLNQKTPAKDPANNAVYHTLEQPEQRTDDDSYSYPDNTTAANQAPSELEYTYAKDTDIPRATTDTEGVSVGKSAPVTDGALYHNLEQEEPMPSENEYSYAKNTEIPSIDMGTQPKTNALSRVPNNELYLTPEELNPSQVNPSQAPVYSTLEEPDVNTSTEQVRMSHYKLPSSN